MADVSSLSFAKDIRPMFTDLDVAHMKPLGADLSDWEAVKAHADAIYQAVASGVMPPPSSGEARWTPDMCDRFKRWQGAGCPP
jgi:tyrosinase